MMDVIEMLQEAFCVDPFVSMRLRGGAHAPDMKPQGVDSNGFWN